MAQNPPASQNHRSASSCLRARSLPRSLAGSSAVRIASLLRSSAALFALVAAVLFACAVVASSPLIARADSYTMPQIDIDAQAETDGSLHVVEQRTFDFEGSCSVVTWTFDDLPSNSEVVVNSVRMASMGDDSQTSGYPQIIGYTPFALSWRDGGGPKGDAYSVDRARDTVYVFFDATDERRLIEIDYTVTNGVTAYSDVGEIEWKFISSRWDVDSENVTLTVSLPVPSGASAVPGSNVRAWGHGPADGVVEVNDDGSVVCEVPRVEAGSFAETRVVFPSEWLTNLPSGTAQPHRTEARLSSVLSEEGVWIDQDNRAFSLELAYIIGCALVCAALLLVGLIAYLRCGKEHVPAFKDEYLRELPSGTVHPALLGRVWRWNHRSEDDLVATAMRLSNIGAVRIAKVTCSDQEGGCDFELTRRPAICVELADLLDRKALEILFDVAAEGGDAIRISQIAAFKERCPQRFDDAVKAWESMLSQTVGERSFFERKSLVWRTRALVLAAVAAAVALASWSASGSFIPLLFGALSAAGLVLLANYMPRRSVEGNELCARSKALRNWLRDRAQLDERPSSDLALWGDLMVCAYLFGVSGRALDALKGKLPDAADAEAHPSWLLWHEKAPVSGAEALRAAVSRRAVKRDGV